MSRSMGGLFYLFYRVRLISPPCLLLLLLHVGNSSWMGTGLELWPGFTFLCWFWAIPPPLSPWRFIVLNFQGFFFLKAWNKGRFVEDLYVVRARVWSIFQRGKIKC